jgi:hypothetical protein
MSIFVEVTSDQLEVSFSDLPGRAYRSNMATLICDAASEPYRRGQSGRWFATPQRPTLMFMNGRPC